MLKVLKETSLVIASLLGSIVKPVMMPPTVLCLIYTLNPKLQKSSLHFKVSKSPQSTVQFSILNATRTRVHTIPLEIVVMNTVLFPAAASAKEYKLCCPTASQIQSDIEQSC